MTDDPAAPQSNAARVREINDSIRYTMWSVFRLEAVLGEDADRVAESAEVEKLFAELGEGDVVVRGVYDVSGLRADADVMVWWHAATSEELQLAYHRFRRTAFGRRLDPGVVAARPAPAGGVQPQPRAGVPRRRGRQGRTCASIRSCAPTSGTSSRRRSARQLLKEHGQMARDYKDVRANTVASFALGDYEWILAFEADELYRIVDLMRHLRASGARRHVREEIPFYTGSLVAVADLVDRLPVSRRAKVTVRTRSEPSSEGCPSQPHEARDAACRPGPPADPRRRRLLRLRRRRRRRLRPGWLR